MGTAKLRAGGMGEVWGPPGDGADRDGRGARIDWGVYREGRGEDPSELYAAAIGDFGEAIERDRANATTWRFSGTARAGKESVGGGRRASLTPRKGAASIR
jgi:hypothetical protein